MGPPVCIEVGCGNGRIDRQLGEECDDDAADCVNCRISPIDVSAGGSYPGGFQPSGFDLFTFDLAGHTELRLETNNGLAQCFVDTTMELYQVTIDGDLRLMERAENGVALCAVINRTEGRGLPAGRYMVKVFGPSPLGVDSFAQHTTFR